MSQPFIRGQKLSTSRSPFECGLKNDLTNRPPIKSGTKSAIGNHSRMARADAERPRLCEGKAIGPFEVRRRVGHGGYGDIYAAVDSASGAPCAVKIEFITAPHQALFAETQVMLRLRGCALFPELLAHGVQENFRYLAMPLFGPSLSAMRRALPARRVAAPCLLYLALEMLACLEALHGRGFVHRDVKPGNFLIRPDRTHPLCLIDFGLSEPFLVPATQRHVWPAYGVGFAGTLKYASLNAHAGKRLSRRDDLASWFYALVELAHGALPWRGDASEEDVERLKRAVSVQALCGALPREFRAIWRVIAKTRFKDAPDYAKIRALIRRAMRRAKADAIPLYDWEALGSDALDAISAVPLEMRNGEPGDPIPGEAEGACVVCAVA
jgi:serine/threonine protein kinase